MKIEKASENEIGNSGIRPIAAPDDRTLSPEELTQHVEEMKRQLASAVELQKTQAKLAKVQITTENQIPNNRSRIATEIGVILGSVAVGTVIAVTTYHQFWGKSTPDLGPIASASQSSPPPSATSLIPPKPTKIATPEDLAANIQVPATQKDFFPNGTVTSKYYEILQQNEEGNGWETVSVKPIKLPNGRTGKNTTLKSNTTIAAYVSSVDPMNKFKLFDPNAKNEGKNVVHTVDQNDPHISYYYFSRPSGKGCTQVGFSMGKNGVPERANDFQLGECYERR